MLQKAGGMDDPVPPLRSVERPLLLSTHLRLCQQKQSKVLQLFAAHRLYPTVRSLSSLYFKNSPTNKANGA